MLLREGIARLLGDAGFEVVAQAGDAEDLMRKVRAHKPDVAIVDIRMPPTHTDDGLRAALTIRRELPDTAVLVLSSYVQEDYAVELLGESAAGVGYLLKDRVADVERFIDSIRRVASSGSVLDPEVVSQMLGRHGLLERQPPRLRPPRRGQIHIDRTRDDKLTPSRVAQHEPYALSLGSSSGRDQSSSYEDDLTALGASSIPASRPSASRITRSAYAAA